MDEMDLKEDLMKNDIVILIVQKNDITNKLVEANKLTKTDPKVSVMMLRKATLDDISFIKYVHNVISQVRLAGLKGLFLCLKEDLNEQLMEDLKMFVDELKEV
jgi:hypothetical protein